MRSACTVCVTQPGSTSPSASDIAYRSLTTPSFALFAALDWQKRKSERRPQRVITELPFRSFSSVSNVNLHETLAPAWCRPLPVLPTGRFDAFKSRLNTVKEDFSPEFMSLLTSVWSNLLVFFFFKYPSIRCSLKAFLFKITGFSCMKVFAYSYGCNCLRGKVHPDLCLKSILGI